MGGRRAIVLHPYWIAAYSVFALVEENADTTVSIGGGIASVLIALGVTHAAWMVSRHIVTDHHRRGIITLAITVFFCFYGPFSNALWLSAAAVGWGHDWILLVAWSMVTVGAGILLVRRKQDLAWFTRYLNMAAAILVLFPVIAVARHGWLGSTPGAIDFRVTATSAEVGGGIGEADALEEPLPIASRALGTEYPDVYLIILDKYTGSRALADYYGFDNSGFEQALRDLGFFVPSRSRANYIHTFLSLASMLNWTHLHEVGRQAGLDGSDRSIPYRMIEDNRTAIFLKERGYEFIHFRSTYPPTVGSRLADYQLPREAQAVGVSIERAWLSGTVLQPALPWILHRITAICERLGCNLSRRFPYPTESPKAVVRKLEAIASLPRDDRPRFVFAHLLLPHEPYIFDADCGHRAPVWPLADTGVAQARVAELYTAQIACTNRLILRLVHQILNNSEEPPIIILQSDHGHGRIHLNPLRGHHLPLESVSRDQLRERIEVFAAYLVPQGVRSAMYDSITPVNVLPVIFNELFGAHIPLEADETYWSEWRLPYRFTKVSS